MDMSANEPSPTPFGGKPPPRRSRHTYVTAVLVLAGVWLLLHWQHTAVQWEGRGCTERAYEYALFRGEPEWYEFCTKKERP